MMSGQWEGSDPAGRPQAAPARRRRGPHRAVVSLSALLIVLGGLTVAGLTMLVVWTHVGQRADERSLWSVAVAGRLRSYVTAWLDVVSVQFIVSALGLAVILALARGRPGAALRAIALVAGANITTQVLKAAIPRPEYGVGPAMNSLPSGHTTVMTSLVLALLIAAGRPLRPVLVLLTSAVATFTGAATVIERWHRPSDVIAAFGVCAAWAGIVLLLGLIPGRRAWGGFGGRDPARGADGRRHSRTGRPGPQSAQSPRPRSGARIVGYTAAGLLGAAGVGVLLVVGGLVAHGEPSNVLVGAVMLTATGLTGVLLAVLVATTLDALDDLAAHRAARADSGPAPSAARVVPTGRTRRTRTATVTGTAAISGSTT